MAGDGAFFYILYCKPYDEVFVFTIPTLVKTIVPWGNILNFLKMKGF